MNGVRWRTVLALTGLLALGLWGVQPAFAQQTGTIQGTIVEGTTNRPLASVQVSIPGTPHGTLSNAQGRFQLVNVPAGTHTLRAELIGHAPITRTVTVVAGQAVSVALRLESEAIALQEIVVTGVAEATPRAALPFAVDQLRATDIVVPPVNAGAAIQGRVAGASVVSGSGRPGSGQSILLRGPTSLNASGRGQGPMIIVDGVILGSSVVDIDGLDIENIEVVKGAAAASMYGSRAAAGVVQITTRSGRGLAEDQVQFGLRSEFGRNDLPRTLGITKSHHYRLSGDPNKPFLSSDGVAFQIGDRRPNNQFYTVTLANTTIWNTFQNQAWPGGTYDHVGTFFTGGTFNQNQVSATGRAGAMNFHASASNLREEGVIYNQPGYDRQSFRVNVDQGLGATVQLSARTSFSRSNSGLFPETSGNPLFNLTRMPAGVDLTRRDTVTGELFILPLPGFQENDNPLEALEKREYSDERDRFLGSANLRWSPLHWLSFDANASYDRSNRGYEDFFPIGFQTARVNTAVNNGHLWRAGETVDALNTSLTTTVRQTFGELNTRLQGRYLYEAQDYSTFETWGSVFPIRGVRTLQATTAQHGRSSQETSVRSEGYFGILNLDFANRYIADALIRRDGSSLFGSDQRWHTYYRLAGAWRIAQEPFWTTDAINELKLRYSVGTAGGRPNFFAQYQTYSVSSTGVVSPISLGNPDLRPEHVTEHEMGLELGFLNRFMFTATHARSTAEDQILPVPMPAVSGWVQQWRNAGTLASNTWELGLEADVMQRGNFGWTARLLWDRTRQEITELNVPPFTYGVGIQGLENVFYARVGEPLGTIYGHKLATQCSDLPSNLQNLCGTEFAMNDDGYFVWVGPGGNTANPQWGTIASYTAGAEPLWWGTPFAAIDEDGNNFMPIGNTQPDYSWSLGNTFTLGGFRLYTLFDAVQGIDVYNMPRHWMTFQLYSAEGDQAGIPEAQQKPIGYYANLYRNLNPKNSHFVEDGSFVKLRELSLGYRLTPQQLGGLPVLNAFSGIGLSITGRNLITWTDYQGYDPEVGVEAGMLGSAALNRFDGFTYPNFRTWTAAVEINF